MDTNLAVCTSRERVLLPGSECLYLKLYCTANNCDHLLRQLIAAFVDSHRDLGLFSKWFFVRYGDPNWHLRVRFFGAPDQLLGVVVPYFTARAKAALEARHLYRVDIGTYEREIERYGGVEAVVAAEALFGIDSDAVLDLLKLLKSNDYLDDRWKIAVISIDRLLNDFGFELPDKLRLMRKLSMNFGAEFGIDDAFKETLSRRFRIERDGLADLLANLGKPTELQIQALRILLSRSENNKRAFHVFRVAFSESRCAQPFDEVVSSFVHMHLNRLLRSAHRAQELVIYNFLQRLYRSMVARE